jgi:hypothetical protein
LAGAHTLWAAVGSRRRESTERGVMGKELSILAHDTVDQPPPATGI